MKQKKAKFRGQDFEVTMGFKDGTIETRRVFASSKKAVSKVAKNTWNGPNGLQTILKVKSGAKWYR